MGRRNTHSHRAALELDLRGTPAARGVGRGYVCSPAALAQETARSAVVVVERSTPAVIPLLLDAAGVLLINGGVLSHVAHICRELGVPCLVDVNAALTTWLLGQKVEIDGTTGVVRLLSESESVDA